MDERTRTNDRAILVNQIRRKYPDASTEQVQALVAGSGTIHEQNEKFGRQGNRYYPVKIRGNWYIGLNTFIGAAGDPATAARVNELGANGLSVPEAIDLAGVGGGGGSGAGGGAGGETPSPNQRGLQIREGLGDTLSDVGDVFGNVIRGAGNLVSRGINAGQAEAERIELERRNSTMLRDIGNQVLNAGQEEAERIAQERRDSPAFQITQGLLGRDTTQTTQPTQETVNTNALPPARLEPSSISIPDSSPASVFVDSPAPVNSAPVRQSIAGPPAPGEPRPAFDATAIRQEGQRAGFNALAVDLDDEIAAERQSLLDAQARGVDRALQANQFTRAGAAQNAFEAIRPGTAFTNLDSLSSPGSIDFTGGTSLKQIRGIGQGTQAVSVSDIAKVTQSQNRVTDILRENEEFLADTTRLDLAARQQAADEANAALRLQGRAPTITIEDTIDPATRQAGFEADRVREAALQLSFGGIENSLLTGDNLARDVNDAQGTTSLLKDTQSAYRFQNDQIVKSLGIDPTNSQSYKDMLQIQRRILDQYRGNN